jgi:hypothetical protein
MDPKRNPQKSVGTAQAFRSTELTSAANCENILGTSMMEGAVMWNLGLRFFVALAGGLALCAPAETGLAASPSFRVAQASGFPSVPRPPAIWTVETRSKTVSLKGAEGTESEMTRFVITCGSTPPLVLVVTFDAGNNAQHVMTLRAVSLVAGSERPRLMGREMRRDRRKQLVTLTYRLDDRMVAAIRQAERVGIQLQTTFESSFFHGFDSMSFEGGAAKWPEFMSACEKLRASAPR